MFADTRAVDRSGGGCGCGSERHGEGCGANEVDRRRLSFRYCANLIRDGGPTIFAEVKNGKGVDNIVGLILSAWKGSGAYDVSRERWKSKGQQSSTTS